MGKTETIKKRRVDVYLRTEQQKERWSHYAERQKSSLSKVIINTMESLIEGDLMDQLDAKENLTRKNTEQSEEIEQLKMTNRRQERYIELLETEMNRTKMSTFLDPGPGIRHYEKDLIQIFKDSKGPVSNNEILRLVKVDPNDSGSVQGISNQLEALSSYGIVKYSSRGWIWNG